MGSSWPISTRSDYLKVLNLCVWLSLSTTACTLRFAYHQPPDLVLRPPHHCFTLSCLNSTLSQQYLNAPVSPLSVIMSSKGKKNKDLESQHLSDLQLSELPNIAWDFLLAVAGDRESILGLKPKQIKDYAGDFLDSDEGRFYWPLSDMGQWKYESTHAEVKKWIGELMLRERRRREARDSASIIDKPEESSSSKSKTTPFKGRTEATPKTISPGTRHAKLGDGTRGLGLVTSMAKKAPVTPVSPVSPTRRTKSPTIAPDVPYEGSSQLPTSTLRKTIRPTPASILIAEERFRDTDISQTQNSARDGTESFTVEVGGIKSPVTPRKRPAEEGGARSSSSPSTGSTTERPSKKMALDPSGRPSEPSVPQSTFFERSTLSASAPVSRTMMPPPKPEQENSITETGTKPPVSSLPSVAAYGLQFSVDNLAKIPESVINYIVLCHDHYIRLANGTQDATLKDEYRAKSTLFQKLHADLESRIKCLAQDAEEKQRVESSHCLWK